MEYVNFRGFQISIKQSRPDFNPSAKRSFNIGKKTKLRKLLPNIIEVELPYVCYWYLIIKPNINWIDGSYYMTLIISTANGRFVGVSGYLPITKNVLYRINSYRRNMYFQFNEWLVPGDDTFNITINLYRSIVSDIYDILDSIPFVLQLVL